MSNTTDRQQTAWLLRHNRHWTLERIGRKMGISRSGVCQLLRRAQGEVELYRTRRHPTPTRRVIRPAQLSSYRET